MTQQCEGYRRFGGAFTIGAPIWEQCKNDAIVIITCVQDGESQFAAREFPACETCWKEAVERNMQINKVTPI